MRTGKSDDAFESFMGAAKGGHAGAMYNVARMLYQRGERTPAIAWFERAAQQTEDAKAAKDATTALEALLGQPVNADGLHDEL